MLKESDDAETVRGSSPDRPSGLLWVAAVVLIAALGWGLEQVAIAPLEAGDVYPAYSSLRSDPVGTKALYESLAALPDLTVERLYKPRTVVNAQAALFVLGVDPMAWETISQRTLTEYEDLVHGGGRLVIAFLPVRAPRRPPQTSSTDGDSVSSRAKPNQANPDQAKPVEKNVIQDRWHIQLFYRTPAESDADDDSSGIPRHTALSFEPVIEQSATFEQSENWGTIARRDDSITAVERSFGEGSVVLVADSYPLSNEGLREARDAEFIARLAGPARHIIFEENHFGVAETGSVATLMRKYHLGGAVAVLALVSGLFLWRGASSFLPPRSDPSTGSLSKEAIAGRDAFEGMTALLRRGVPEKNLLDVCYAEWARSAGPRSQAHLGEPSQLVESEIARLGKRDPVSAYRAACRILSNTRNQLANTNMETK